MKNCVNTWMYDFLIYTYDDKDFVDSLDKRTVWRVLSEKISERDLIIIKIRFEDGGGASYAYIGRMFNLSPSRVRQIINRQRQIIKSDSTKNLLTCNGKKYISNDDSIGTLDLSIRPYNCLMRANIRTINDLINSDLDRLLKIRNLGRKSLKEVVDKVHQYGLKMSDDVEEAFDGKRYAKGLTLKAISKIIYIQSSASYNRPIKVVKMDDNTVLWEGSAEELRHSDIIDQEYMVNEILVNRTIESEKDLPDYDKAKIITVY